ncbi:MAG: transcriptional regulator MntR [Alphaproteobacteria bacterium]|nr:transcriptional regulator MntR [Alphaproteobacteria bacterium]HCQ70533.1 transcriptional regulator MntR [Rhodospirillaceae bacterium]|tara:strand:- start:73397 stop:73825 length:429 start_codon:yes stop_codon:yes gene_type:complete
MTTKPSQLVDAQTQAKWFARVREARQTETKEDYVELIADLIAANNEARLSDLAARLGVSHPTANKVIARLQDDGYVTSEPYRSIFLTEKGAQLAQQCKQRHQIVLDFLIRLGVPPETAEFDAEGIEHHISAETLGIMKHFKG